MKKQWMVLAVIAMGCLSAYAQAVSGNATMNGIDVLNQREAQLNDGLYAAAGNKVERAYWELTPEDELLDSTVSVSATGVRGYKVVYFYDSLRRLDYTLHYEGICPNRQLKNKDQYTYDGYGNKGSWEVLFWFNSSWLSLQLHEWQYSADGDMLLYNYRNIQRYEWV